MAVKMIDKKVLSSDGVHELIGRAYIPDSEIKGLFHVVHGMTEHIGRYDLFMREMAKDGYIVFGYDHLGHGKTARDKSELGFIADKNGDQKLVDDVAIFAKEMQNEYGKDLPYILLGHSMGSFIVRLAAAKYDMQDKLIVMGTGGPNIASGAGIALTNVIKALRGKKHISYFIENVALGSYNKKFKDEGEKAWLTKIDEIRRAYLADPFCTFHFTVSAMGDLVKLQRGSNKKTTAQKMNGRKILLVSGSDDPVGSYGKGVRKVYDMLKKSKADVKMKIYENCRHEILNDTCRSEVIEDIRNFINN